MEAQDGFLDISGARVVEFQISADGKVIWVHTDQNTKLRICNIDGGIRLTDRRPRNRRGEPKNDLQRTMERLARGLDKAMT